MNYFADLEVTRDDPEDDAIVALTQLAGKNIKTTKIPKNQQKP